MLLTSARNAMGTAKARELEVAAYLTKPIRQSTLLNAIVTTFGGRVAGQLAEQQSPDVDADMGLRILLAEDHPPNQILAVKLLEARGNQVTIANNGREAIASLAENSFDVVLMDVQMPEMDGLSATTAIREREAGTSEHIPIIGMTAHVMRGDRERCLKAGMDDYLAKPIRRKLLYEMLQKFVAPRDDQTGDSPAITATDSAVPEMKETPPAADQTEASMSNTQPGSNVDQVLDLATLRAEFDGDEELLLELMDAYFPAATVLLGQIREAIQNGDAETLASAAHTIKGGSGNFFARTVFSMAERLEEMGESGTVGATVGELCDQLETEIGQLKSTLGGLGKS
jgi:CheY-like chemotaxis protein/HPt (histidine-containing phosphotransfer) domain-containing protein